MIIYIKLDMWNVIPLTIPVFNNDMRSAALNSLNNELLVGGESVNRFEEEFARYIGTDYAAAVNSGSSAILLTFKALEIKVGDKVIAPSATFVATLNGPVLLGAVPKFCDINDHYVMSSNHMSKLIQRNACEYVIPVHLYGQPCDMLEIEECTRQNGVTIIEDAAQAHGAKYKNRMVGSFGEAAIFSFYPTKNMTVGGDGGMVTTNNKKIYNSVTKMRDVGRKTKYTHDEIGYTLRLNTVNAAIGLVQLKNLEEWNEKRRAIARNYQKCLGGIGDLILPPNSEDPVDPVFHMYVLRTRYRNLLGTWLMMNEISTGVHYPIPVHKQPSYRKFDNTADLGFTNEWCQSILSLPIHPQLSKDDQGYIIQMIISFFDQKLHEDPKVMEIEKKWAKRLI
jgi:perosamine synthetase